MGFFLEKKELTKPFLEMTFQNESCNGVTLYSVRSNYLLGVKLQNHPITAVVGGDWPVLGVT